MKKTDTLRSTATTQFRFRHFFLLLAAFMFGMNDSDGQAIYVAYNGSNSNNTGASASSPYKTIQHAINQVPVNNTVKRTIYVKAGYYFENVIVNRPNIDLVGYTGVINDNCIFSTSNTAASPSYQYYKQNEKYYGGSGTQFVTSGAPAASVPDVNTRYPVIQYSAAVVPAMDYVGLNIISSYVTAKNFVIKGFDKAATPNLSNCGVAVSGPGSGESPNYVVSPLVGVKLENIVVRDMKSYYSRGICITNVTSGNNSTADQSWLKNSFVLNSTGEGISIVGGQNFLVNNCKVFCDDVLNDNGGGLGSDFKGLDYYFNINATIYTINSMNNIIQNCYAGRMNMSIPHGGHAFFMGGEDLRTPISGTNPTATALNTITDCTAEGIGLEVCAFRGPYVQGNLIQRVNTVSNKGGAIHFGNACLSNTVNACSAAYIGFLRSYNESYAPSFQYIAKDNLAVNCLIDGSQNGGYMSSGVKIGYSNWPTIVIDSVRQVDWSRVHSQYLYPAVNNKIINCTFNGPGFTSTTLFTENNFYVAAACKGGGVTFNYQHTISIQNCVIRNYNYLHYPNCQDNTAMTFQNNCFHNFHQLNPHTAAAAFTTGNSWPYNMISFPSEHTVISYPGSSNNMYRDPLFSTTLAYHPSATSPLLNNAQVLSSVSSYLLNDKSGTARNAQWDIGCYESNSSSMRIASEEIKTEILVFPNPANEQITIQSGEENPVLEIMICDLSGRVVMQRQTASSASETIPVSDLPAGIYVALVKTANETKTEKIVIYR